MKLKYKHLLVVIIGTVIIFVMGCQQAQPPVDNFTADNSQNERVKIERIGIINDHLAYNWTRGIYIITDTKTGKEYIGVSGIGISEVGRSGKITVER